MLEIINIIFVSIFQTLSCTYVALSLTNKKINFSKKINIFLLISIAFSVFFMNFLNFGFIKVIILYFLITICYKYIFNISFNESIIVNFISLILQCLVEILLGLFIIIFNISNSFFEQYFQQTILSSSISFILIIILILILKKSLIKLQKKLSEEKTGLIFYIVIVIILSVLFYLNINTNLENWKNNNEFLINIITVLLFIILSIFIIEEKLKVYKINKQFSNLYNQSQIISSLLEKYQKINHENQNELIIIREMIKDTTEATKYINEIINDKKIPQSEKWIVEANKIKDREIRGFLLLKTNEMIDNNVNIIMHISKNVSKYDFKQYGMKNYKDLCKLIGIYLDNAHDACLNSYKKEITIEMFFKNKKLSIIISNTFSGEIDIKSIGKKGYTTKGQGHGMGLSIAKSIINNNEIFEQRKEIINNYYYQYLYIYSN